MSKNFSKNSKSRSFLVLTIENDSEEIVYDYFYEPKSKLYSGSLEQISSKFNFLYFLHCKNIDIRVNVNLLSQIEDLESFHVEFEKLYYQNSEISSAINDANMVNDTKTPEIKLIDSSLLDVIKEE